MRGHPPKDQAGEKPIARWQGSNSCGTLHIRVGPNLEWVIASFSAPSNDRFRSRNGYFRCLRSRQQHPVRLRPDPHRNPPQPGPHRNPRQRRLNRLNPRSSSISPLAPPYPPEKKATAQTVAQNSKGSNSLGSSGVEPVAAAQAEWEGSPARVRERRLAVAVAAVVAAAAAAAGAASRAGAVPESSR